MQATSRSPQKTNANMTIIKRQAYIITTPLYVVVVLFGVVIVVVSLMAGSCGSSSDSINNNGGGTATATSATTPCTTFVGGGGVTAFVHSNTAVTVVGTITKSKYYTPLTLTLTANKNNNDNNDNQIIRRSSSRRRSKPYYDFTNINAAALLSRSTQSSLASSSLVSLASTSSFELNNDDYSKNHNKRRHNFKIDHTVDDNTDTDTDTDNRKLVDVVQVTLPSMERYRNLTSLKSNNNNKSDATKNDHSDDFDIYDDEKISLNPIIRKYRRLVSQKQKNDGQQLQQKQQVMKKFFVFIRLLSYPFSLLSSILRRWCISIVSSQRKYYYYFRRNSNGYDDTFNRRNRNANVNIGGKKRHLILLLSSMLSGMFGIRPANIMCKSNGSGSGDVVASISRLEQTIHTHHHLDVSSYSSSSSTTAYGREWLNKNNKLEKKKKKKNKI